MRALIRPAALIILCAGWGGQALAQALAQSDADAFRNKTVKFIITFEPGGSYDLYARTEEGRRIFEFQNSDAGIGWSVVAPPNVPPGRLALLRRAFDAMVADPEFRAEAHKRGLDITPASGKELEDIVSRTIATPAAALVTLKKLLGIQ